MLRPTTCETTTSAISSPASEDGPKLYDLHDGQTIDKCGQEAVPANRSHVLEKRQESTTTGICGRCSTDSSENVNPRQCSGSKLQVSMSSAELTEKMGKCLRRKLLFGSMEYSTTWRPHSTPARRLIYRLRASAQHISGNASTGAERVTGWPTVLTGVRTHVRNDRAKGLNYGEDVARVILRTKQDRMGLFGRITPFANSSTVPGDVPNLTFIAWLMGYRSLWLMAAPNRGQSLQKCGKDSVTRSYLKLRRSSY